MDPIFYFHFHSNDLRPIGNIFSLQVYAKLNENIGILTMTPGLPISVIKSYAKMDGIVLQSFGAGNVPQREDILKVFKTATKSGCIIVNVTQCKAGAVNGDYECGRQLMDCGVISGFDMVKLITCQLLMI